MRKHEEKNDMEKSFKRLLPVLIIALLVLVPALPVFAQSSGTSQGICNGLSDADCQTLTTAQANLSNITSFSSSAWSVDFNASDTKTNVAFSGSGTGEFVLPSGTDSSGLLIHLMISDLNATDGTTTVTMKDSEVIVTDKMAYVKYNGTWYGQELTAQDLNSMGLGSLGSMMGSANGGSANGGTANALSSLGIDLTGVVTTTRGADASVNGNSVQVFTTTFDLGKLIGAVLASPAIAPLMGNSGSSMTPDQLGMIGQMVTPMLGTTGLTLEESVGSDGNLAAVKLDVVLDIDPSLFSPGTGKITGNFTFSTDLSGVNQSYTATEPSSYQPMSDLNAILNGTSG
jgi:hypothetical protein